MYGLLLNTFSPASQHRRQNIFNKSLRVNCCSFEDYYLKVLTQTLMLVLHYGLFI